MKFLLLSLLSISAAFAGVADVTCNTSQPIVIEGTFGNVAFRNAEFDFVSVDQTNSFSTFLTVQDRFGSAFESFTNLYEEKFRCSSNSYCLQTEFSRLNGLGFEFPAEVFTEESHRFTMRIRNNLNRRTIFARCESTLR